MCLKLFDVSKRINIWIQRGECELPHGHEDALGFYLLDSNKFESTIALMTLDSFGMNHTPFVWVDQYKISANLNVKPILCGVSSATIPELYRYVRNRRVPEKVLFNLIRQISIDREEREIVDLNPASKRHHSKQSTGMKSCGSAIRATQNQFRNLVINS